MKKGILIYLLTSAVCLANIKVDTIKKSGTTKKYTYEFSYPSLSLDGKTLPINQEIEKNISYNIKGFTRVGEHNPYSDRPYEAQSIFKDYKNNFGITSILESIYTYTGGNHGMTGFTSYNISNKTGKNLKFNDIFRRGAREYFEKEIRDTIIKDVKVNKEKTKYFRDSSTRFVDLDNAVVFFRGDNLVIRYQQYAIAPYSSGTPEFEFSKEEIREFLKEI